MTSAPLHLLDSHCNLILRCSLYHVIRHCSLREHGSMLLAIVQTIIHLSHLLQIMSILNQIKLFLPLFSFLDRHFTALTLAIRFKILHLLLRWYLLTLIVQ